MLYAKPSIIQFYEEKKLYIRKNQEQIYKTAKRKCVIKGNMETYLFVSWVIRFEAMRTISPQPKCCDPWFWLKKKISELKLVNWAIKLKLEVTMICMFERGRRNYQTGPLLCARDEDPFVLALLESPKFYWFLSLFACLCYPVRLKLGLVKFGLGRSSLSWNLALQSFGNVLPNLKTFKQRNYDNM